MINFILALFITIIFHELAHLLVAVSLGIKIDAYSIGFCKPIWKRMWKGIEWRLSPILLGGYVAIKGEMSREHPDDFLNHPYWKKFLVCIAGCFMNILIALICYLINYGSIKTGLVIDWQITKFCFLKDWHNPILLDYFRAFKPNFFLLQLSVMNISCGLLNLIPVVPMDGGLVWYLAVDKWVNNFWQNLLFKVGWAFVILSQVWMVWYIYILK